MHDQSWENEKIIEIIIPDCYAQTFPTVCNAHDTPMKRATMKEQNRKIPKNKTTWTSIEWLFNKY